MTPTRGDSYPRRGCREISVRDGPRVAPHGDFSLDDSLDVVAAHGVGGTVGALLTGVFANKALNGLADGALARRCRDRGLPLRTVRGGRGNPALVAAILAALASAGVPALPGPPRGGRPPRPPGGAARRRSGRLAGPAGG